MKEIEIEVPSGAAAAWKLSLDNQAKMQKSMCSIFTPAIPESWAYRVGTGRPQLVIVYAEIFSSGKLSDSRWSLTIPHYVGTEKTRILLPAYNRGNWHGTLTLIDGSQIVVNAASSSECKRMLNRLKIMVPIGKRMETGDFTVKPRVTENPNLKMKQCRVTPVCAKFYATGQKTLAPTWTQNLRVK